MRAYAVVNAFGADRVGLVDDISEAVLGLSCNIEESKMALLGGEFAVIALVSGEADQVASLLSNLDVLADKLGIAITGRPTSATVEVPSGRPYRIESASLDSPGIVHAVTALLREFSINIEELETETSGAPFTGAPMFHMRILAVVPSSVRIKDLRVRLQDISVDQDLDISILPVTQ